MQYDSGVTKIGLSSHLWSIKLPSLSLTFTCLFWCAAVANPQVSDPSHSVPHFRWSERLAHELSYQNTIASTKELTPSERKELLDFVLHRFEHPINSHDAAMFEGIPNEQMQRLAADTRIELLDLNGDGQDEIIAQGNGLGPCGGTGNCIVLVLQRTPTGLKTLLDSRAGKSSGGFEKIRVLGTATNGFRDIVLASHVSASDRTIEFFRFADGQYRRSECYYATTQPAGIPDGLEHPRITLGCPGEK